MATWASEGIILKRNNWGETDKTLTIFTRQRGKVRVLAKGVRRVHSRRAPNIELFNHSKLFFHESKETNILAEADTVTSFNNLKSDLNKISYAYRIAEVIDHFFPEATDSAGLFELILDCLETMDASGDSISIRLTSTATELKLLAHAGFRPQLFVCSKCSRALIEQTHLLSPEHGGLIDRGCNGEMTLSKPVSVEAIKLLRFLMDSPWEEVVKLRVSESVSKEVDQALSFYLEYILEEKLRSTNFINKVESL